MIVLTGTDGFIGKNLFEYFSTNTSERILTVDFNSEIGPFDFLERLQKDKFKNIQVIIHNGACSDTMCCDPHFMMKHNFDYTSSLFKHCLNNDIRMIYASSASVYGDGPFCEAAFPKPKNLYALSKSLFDNYSSYFNSNVVGLRYFNVYGKYEEDKKHMASVVYKFFVQKNSGKIKLFEKSENYLRDFLHVDDVCEITYKIFKNKKIFGIFNIGTGEERSFLDIANLFKKKYNIEIETIPMPAELVSTYQKFTKSDNTKFKKFITHNYLSLEQGVDRYLRYLENK